MAGVAFYSKGSTGEYKFTRGFMHDFNNVMGGSTATLHTYPAALSTASALLKYCLRTVFQDNVLDTTNHDLAYGPNGGNAWATAQLRNSVIQCSGVSSSIEFRNSSTVPADLRIFCFTPRFVTDVSVQQTYENCKNGLRISGEGLDASNTWRPERAWTSPMQLASFREVYDAVVDAHVHLGPGQVRKLHASLPGRYLRSAEFDLIDGQHTLIPGLSLIWMAISQGSMVAVKNPTVPDFGSTTFVHPTINFRGMVNFRFRGFMNPPMVHDYQNMTFYDDDGTGNYIGYPQGMIGRDGLYRAFGNESALTHSAGVRQYPTQAVTMIGATALNGDQLDLEGDDE